jgi:hypothetical protein
LSQYGTKTRAAVIAQITLICCRADPRRGERSADALAANIIDKLECPILVDDKN